VRATFTAHDSSINVQDPFNSQRYNRYSYVMNNPLKYTDPTGYDVLAPGESSSDGENRARGYMDTYDSDGDGNITGNEMGYGKGRDGDYKEEKEKFIAGGLRLKKIGN